MESQLKILQHLEQDPRRSQRSMASLLGISLGKVNYCLQALIDKGLIKAQHFITSDNKRAYRYLLTPKGLEEKSHLTVKFLQRKMREYELLGSEIRELQKELRSKEPVGREK